MNRIMNNARSFLRLLTLLLVVSLHSLVAYNQNLNDDLKKVVGHLDSAASVSLSVDVKLYTKKGGELMYSTKASIDRKGKSSVTVLGDVEIFNNDDFRVDIDHEEKMMMITPKKEIIKKTKKEMQFDISDLAKLHFFLCFFDDLFLRGDHHHFFFDININSEIIIVKNLNISKNGYRRLSFSVD